MTNRKKLLALALLLLATGLLACGDDGAPPAHPDASTPTPGTPDASPPPSPPDASLPPPSTPDASVPPPGTPDGGPGSVGAVCTALCSRALECEPDREIDLPTCVGFCNQLLSQCSADQLQAMVACTTQSCEAFDACVEAIQCSP